MSPPLPPNEAKRIEALRAYRILDTPAEAVFDDIAEIASALCQTPIALMTLIDSDRQWFKAKVGLEGSETPREHAFCAYTILSSDIMVVEDAARDRRFADNPFVKSDPHVRFYAGAPLIDSSGNALGSLCAVDSKPRQISAQQQRSLAALARSVVTHLEFRRASADLAAALEDLETVHGLLPICAGCKEIRDDKGYWSSVEEYMGSRADVTFSHGICPTCCKKLYPDIYEQISSAKKN